MKLDPQLANSVGLGLGVLSLVLQLSQPKVPDNQALYQFSREAIQSARGTTVCISWDCGGMPAQETQAPQPKAVVYQEVEPGVQYVDTSGQPLPTIKSDGRTYLALTR